MTSTEFYRKLHDTFVQLAANEINPNIPEDRIRFFIQQVCEDMNFRNVPIPTGLKISPEDVFDWGQGLNYLKAIHKRPGCVVKFGAPLKDEPRGVFSIASPNSCYANVQATLEMSADVEDLVPMGGCLVWLAGKTLDEFIDEYTTQHTLSKEDERKLSQIENPAIQHAMRQMMMASGSVITPWSFRVNAHAFFLYKGKVFDPTLLSNPVEDWYYVGFPLDRKKLLTGKRLTGTPSKVVSQLPLSQSSKFLTVQEVLRRVKSGS